MDAETPNMKLADKLERAFKGRGIAAFCRCCRPTHSATYSSEPDYQFRQGINGFQLYLSGMNYTDAPQECCIYFDDQQYLQDHWEEEQKIISEWASLVEISNYTLEVHRYEWDAGHVLLTYHPDSTPNLVKQ